MVKPLREGGGELVIKPPEPLKKLIFSSKEKNCIYYLNDFKAMNRRMDAGRLNNNRRQDEVLVDTEVQKRRVFNLV